MREKLHVVATETGTAMVPNLWDWAVAAEALFHTALRSVADHSDQG